jgi:toxin co-regulated pilus biosynthesis protein E
MMDVQELLGKFTGGAQQSRGVRGANDFTTWFEKLKFGMMPKQRAEFYEMLGALLADGKPLDSAVRELETRYTKKKRPLAALMRLWLGSLDEGKPFAEALRGFASDTEVVIIAATEKSGDLANGFLQAASVARAGAAIRGVLAAEMTTPAIQAVALFGMLIGFSTSMAPEMVQSVPLAAMDDSQRALFGLAAVVASTWYILLPLLVVGLAAAFWSMPRYTGALRPMMDRLPPWSVYRVYSGATFMISLSALIKAGVPIDSGIRFIRQQSSPWMREHMATMSGRLRAGVEQGEALDTGLLSDRMADMVAIYSKTSNFDAAVSTVGRMSMDDGLVNIKRKAGAVRTLTTILIGVLVGWIFTAVMGISDAATRANTMTQQQLMKNSRQ